MRIEVNYLVLIIILVGVFLVLALSKANIPRKLYKILLALVVAIAMPSFIPGHGEAVMLIPTGALFNVVSNEAKVVGVIFKMINYFIVWFILYKIFGFFKHTR